MATGLHNNQEKVPENLKKQLVLAVRSIQWSYAIFWSISATEPGVLEWGDGYYNGDIKTRKTVQASELNADQLSLQRSEQLRELYGSLSAGEGRRPSSALSPEDLTDTEWYYLVCMSFVFNIGQGLPGKTLANGQHIWLCNAHYADSKVFSRSLLAKSASIQTVVCFPYLEGVIEMGVTELVLEDPGLVQLVKTTFLDVPCPIVSTNNTGGEQQLELIPVIRCEELGIASPINSSNFEPADDSFMVEGINGGTSQVQSWQFVDENFSNRVHHSVNSSDCISQTIVDPAKAVPGSNDEKVEDRCHAELRVLDLQDHELHYQTVLSSLLKTSHPLILGMTSRNCCDSSFVNWTKVGLMHCRKFKGGTPQKLLKKVLFQVPRMHDSSFLESPEDNCDKFGVRRLEADDIAKSHVLSERKQREKINERFTILKSIIPSMNEVDKVSILDDTIDYLQGLERRVEELESCRHSTGFEIRTKKKSQDSAEKTSDNYGSNKIGNGKRALVNKRKASDIEEMEQDIDHNVSRDGLADNVIVTVNKDVLIEIRCPWREGRLLEIMDALSDLHLEPLSVQSSNVDGILSLTLKSKRKGLNSASADTIRKVLQRVAGRC